MISVFDSLFGKYYSPERILTLSAIKFNFYVKFEIDFVKEMKL
jgi:hypothetical protein